MSHCNLTSTVFLVLRGYCSFIVACAVCEVPDVYYITLRHLPPCSQSYKIPAKIELSIKRKKKKWFAQIRNRGLCFKWTDFRASRLKIVLYLHPNSGHSILMEGGSGHPVFTSPMIFFLNPNIANKLANCLAQVVL